MIYFKNVTDAQVPRDDYYYDEVPLLLIVVMMVKTFFFLCDISLDEGQLEGQLKGKHPA